jgi:prepilin peptidase CpaA
MIGIATLTLIAGMIDDLRSRKIHNNLVLALLGLTVVCSFYFRGLEGSVFGFGAFTLALAMGVLLFTTGVWGGGDVKLFAVFAFAVDPVNMFWTLIYSFVWGGLFGLVRAALQKQLLTLVRNTYKLASRQKTQAQELHKIPYSFALLLGWFTQLTMLRAGGLL